MPDTFKEPKYIYGVNHGGAQIGIIESDERLTHAVISWSNIKDGKDAAVYIASIGEAKSPEHAEEIKAEHEANIVGIVATEIIRLSGVSI